MALATFKLLKCTGTNAATETEMTGNMFAFLSVDSASTDTGSYPVAIPEAAGSNYSYEVWLRWELNALPNNYVQNFIVYGPAVQPDAPTNKLTIMMGATETAATPTANASSVAVDEQHLHYYSVGTHLDITLVPVDDKLNAAGEKTFYCVLQAKVDYGAASGTSPVVLFNLGYEEA